MPKRTEPTGWIFPILIALKAKAFGGKLLREENRNLFLGYLLGFTEPVEDERQRALLNKIQFDAIFGDGLSAIQEAFSLAALRDADFMRGWGFGYPDGERFWETCDANYTCTGEQADQVLISLQSMVEFLD